MLIKGSIISYECENLIITIHKYKHGHGYIKILHCVMVMSLDSMLDWETIFYFLLYQVIILLSTYV